MAAPAHVFWGHEDGVTDMPAATKWGGDDRPIGPASDSAPFVFVHAGYYIDYDFSSSSLDEGWLFTEIAFDRQDAGQAALTLRGATQDLFRIIAVDTVSSSGAQKAQYYNGSTWVDIATLSTSLYSSSGSHRLDIYWKIADSAGEFTVYVNGSSEASVSGIDTLLTSDTTINTVRLESPDAVYTLAVSCVVVDSADTRGLEWCTDIPTSDGTHTEWSGIEADVDNNLYAVGTVGTSCVASADGQRFTLNFPAISAAFSGYTVEWVGVGAQVQAQSEPSLYIKPQVRKSSTDYTPAAGGSYQARAATGTIKVLPLAADPSTGSAWADQSAVEACELGLQASTTA